MTKRLYYHDAAVCNFDGVIVEYGADARHVILDRSAFYPTSGGQPHDTGTLNGVRVVDVLDEDDRVVHVLDAPLPLGPVHGEVDRTRRHDHMQQHTAQHLLSAIAATRFGWQTASVHFGADHSSIEFDTSGTSDAELRELEIAANAAVAAAHPVTISFEEPAEARARGLRKAPERPGAIRIITIESIDRSACGGTHVASTAAIGAVVVHGVERIRGHVRVGFLAGERVIRRLHTGEALLASIAETMSCAVDELPEIAAKRQVELRAQREHIEGLEREVAVSRLHALVAATAADADGIRRVVYRSEGESPTLLRTMAQGVATLTEVVFVATISSPPTVFFASGPGTGIDAGKVLKAALAGAGGRGGGSPKAAQGTVTSPALLPGVVDQLVGRARNAPLPLPD
jgi:alanyl-tRNA synthetase